MKDNPKCWYWHSSFRQFRKVYLFYNSTENNKIQSPDQHRNTTEQEAVMVTRPPCFKIIILRFLPLFGRFLKINTFSIASVIRVVFELCRAWQPLNFLDNFLLTSLFAFGWPLAMGNKTLRAVPCTSGKIFLMYWLLRHSINVYYYLNIRKKQDNFFFIKMLSQGVVCNTRINYQ